MHATTCLSLEVPKGKIRKTLRESQFRLYQVYIGFVTEKTVEQVASRIVGVSFATCSSRVPSWVP